MKKILQDLPFLESGIVIMNVKNRSTSTNLNVLLKFLALSSVLYEILVPGLVMKILFGSLSVLKIKLRRN